MDLDDFRQDFLSQTAAWAAADSNFKHSAFVDLAIRYLEEAGEVADFEPCYFRGIGSKRRALAIDGYAFDDVDGSVRLFLAEETLADEVATLTQTDARASFARIRAFVEDSFALHVQAHQDPSSPPYDLASELAQRRPQLTRIRAYLLTDSVLSSRAKDWPEGEISGIPVEFHIWDVARLHRVYTSRSGQDELVVDFSTFGDAGLPCIQASTDTKEYSAYLCVVPGSVLAAIYDEYGSRLLEGNVRSFLSTRAIVNKGIRNTVLHSPEMFFAYNNGIAATASEIRLHQDQTGMRLVAATDLQIVNGGQTTASLASARRNKESTLDEVFVPMKLSVVSSDRSGEMIPLISRYANSQNKVSDADFFSNHEYHRRLEQISRRLWAPAKLGVQHETHWFYERVRGQYFNEPAALGAADRKRFAEMNPRLQVITKTDLAKSENAWGQLPQVVSRGAQKNFVEFAKLISVRWDSSAEMFHETYYKEAVARVILFRATERIVSAQSWYSGGYRAQTVAYTVGKLAHSIRQSFPGWELDFLAIWNRQVLSSSLATQVAVIAEAMYAVITDPPSGMQNVGEWAKKDRCWEHAVEAYVPVLRELKADLVDLGVVKAEHRTAKAQQRQEVGINAQVAVVKLGQGYWQNLWSWADEKKLLSPDSERLVRVAAGMVSGLPNDKQSKKLLQVKAQMEEEGFAPVAVPT